MIKLVPLLLVAMLYTPSLTTANATVLNLIEQARSGPKLVVDPILNKAAAKRASQIITNFCHCVTPESPYDWGEILAWRITVDPALIVKAWLNSPSHRRVLLGHWNRVGIGSIVKNGNWYVVVLFGDKKWPKISLRTTLQKIQRIIPQFSLPSVLPDMKPTLMSGSIQLRLPGPLGYWRS